MFIEDVEEFVSSSERYMHESLLPMIGCIITEEQGQTQSKYASVFYIFLLLFYNSIKTIPQSEI